MIYYFSPSFGTCGKADSLQSDILLFPVSNTHRTLTQGYFLASATLKWFALIYYHPRCIIV